jgi:hypothetical protein
MVGFDFTKTDIRYSNNPVEIGMIRYVGSLVPGEDIACHVVIEVMAPRKVWDPEFRCFSTDYPYRVRRATKAEQAEHEAEPNGAKAGRRIAA